MKKTQRDAEPPSISTQRDKGAPRRVDAHPELKDFYNEHDDFTVTNKDRNKYNESVAELEDWEKALLTQGKHLYLVDFSNSGGLVTPLVLEIELKSGKKYIERIPAEVWRYSSKKITKLLVTDEPMVSLTQDPYWETADIVTSNNSWPRKITPSRLELFKSEKSPKDMDAAGHGAGAGGGPAGRARGADVPGPVALFDASGGAAGDLRRRNLDRLGPRRPFDRHRASVHRQDGVLDAVEP